MPVLKIKLVVLLLLVASCASCSSREHQHDAFQLPVPQSGSAIVPKTVDPGDPQQLRELTEQLSGQRAIFIGEVHDQLAHHQNQLRLIQSLYARNPDFAIGVEYFQQPFQKYLDDYIAGRINEKEMLVKTEYFRRWQLDYRLLQPIFQFARKNHIPVLALNVPDEIHNKVFKEGMKSLSPAELAQIPADIEPASAHYLDRLKAIFNSHPPSNDFGTFVEGVLLWDETMADSISHYLKAHPQSRVVVLAGLVHVMYGDGIPERVNRQMGSDQSVVAINGNNFADYPGVADYQLVTEGNEALPKSGKLGVSITDIASSGSGGVRVSEFTPGSAAQSTGIAIGDRIVALDGVKVENIPELKSLMFDKQPGDLLQVVVQRSLPANAQMELQFEVVLR